MPDVYTKLRQILEEFPIPVVPGKGIHEFLRLTFTKQEAEMLSKFGSFFKIVTVKEFARQYRYDPNIVREVFNNLARRNLIHYERKAGTEYFRIMPLVVGFYEAFFSTWREQKLDTLIPAAKAIEDYFKDIFHKAASNSKSPWARIIPSLGAIEAIIGENPEYYDIHVRKITITNRIRRIGAIIKYASRTLMKNLSLGKIHDVINVLKSNGFSIAGRIMSLSSLKKGLIKYSPLKKNRTTLKIEKTIPINEKIPMILKIYPYEVIRQYIDQATIISVTPCPCRKASRLRDETYDDTLKIRCKFPVEDTCLHLRYEHQVINQYNLKGGHIISKQEALDILNQCEKAGLVHTSFNSSEKIEFICNCCPCCCGILGTMTKYHQKYRAFVESNFQPIHQKTQCKKCAKCVQICPVHAISQDKEGFPVIDLEICIGCGVCVTNCSKKVLKLVKIRNRHPAIDSIEALVRFANQKVKNKKNPKNDSLYI